MSTNLAEALDLVVARTGHTRYRDLCNPDHPAYNAGYVQLVLERAAQPFTPAPVPPRPAHRLPLAGDLVEHAARRIGMARLTKWLASKGIDCGCAERKDALNRATLILARWLDRNRA